MIPSSRKSGAEFDLKLKLELGTLLDYQED